MSTKGTAATTTRTGSGSGSRVRSAASPLPSVGEMKRRAAFEPVIGHVKAEHRLDRNYFKGRVADRYPRRGRLQLRPAPAMARRTLACHHPGVRRNCPGSKDRLNQRAPAFFTEDE